MSSLKGIMGDPAARIIKLKRIQKKSNVQTAGEKQTAITILKLRGFVIYLQGELASFLSLNNNEYHVRTAKL